MDDQLLRGFEEALPIAMLRSREAVMARFRPMLASHGLTEQQWRVIRAIHANRQIDATRLSERSCILMPSLSRMLKTLEKDGLVIRQRESGDARRQTIVLTERGKNLVAKIAPQSEAIYAEIEKSFGPDHLRDLVKSLRQLRDSLKEGSPSGG